MTRHHYLPASFLGGFSVDIRTPHRRNRELFVGDLHEDRVFVAPAKNVGAINNLYTVTDAELDQDSVDDVWTKYETELPRAITALIKGGIDTITWARVMVPFVACMLVRGPDFNNRFTDRLKGTGFSGQKEVIGPNNINYARTLELQRLLGQVAVFKWVVSEVEGEKALITTDLGYAVFYNPLTRDFGIAIPLSPRHILQIIPRDNGVVAYEKDGTYLPAIEYTKETKDNHLVLNQVLSQMATRFIFGGEAEEIKRLIKTKRVNYLQAPEPSEYGFMDSKYARALEFTWHRLVSFLERSTAGDEPDFDLHWKSIVKGWCPPVILPTNLVEFPSSLVLDGNEIKFRIYDPEIYYEISEMIDLLQLREFDKVLEIATQKIGQTSDPKNKSRILSLRAEAFSGKSDIDSAERDYLEALALDSDNKPAAINYGAILANKKI